jgi:hypothetical protein
MTYTHKKITYDKCHITGAQQKRWSFYNAEEVQYTAPDTWSASPLPDTTERDTFGGIIAHYNN